MFLSNYDLDLKVKGINKVLQGSSINLYDLVYKKEKALDNRKSEIQKVMSLGFAGHAVATSFSASQVPELMKTMDKIKKENDFYSKIEAKEKRNKMSV